MHVEHFQLNAVAWRKHSRLWTIITDTNKKMSQTELKKVSASATLFNGHALQVNEGKQLTIGFGLVAQVFCLPNTVMK